jgi:hypothetical protein
MTVVNAVEVAASTKKNNGETLINIVLDETGSMNSCWDATISSFNDYVGSQKGQDGVCKVTMSMFSSSGYGRQHLQLAGGVVAQGGIRTLYTNKDVNEVELLSRSNYRPNGGTNLYDAIGTTIRNIESQLYGQSEVPNVLIVIITDGGENSSTEFSLAAVKALVQAKETEGWTFVYLGANQDAWQVGQSFGLARGQTMTYSTDNMADTTASLASATVAYRGTRSMNLVGSAAVDREFFDRIDPSKKV